MEAISRSNAPVVGGLLEAGAALGPYEILGALGRGGTSVVYEARHRALGRRVALKVMASRGSSLRDPEKAVARFVREGRVAASVRHPHIVDVFDAGVAGEKMYLAMELVEGDTLARYLAREGALAPDRAAEILLPILSAVGELHAAGVVHRDLKPGNILLARGANGEIHPKVADFGVSRVEDDADGLTDSGALMGTVAYMAPEQHRGARGADERSDLYALGLVLYECLTGSLPFEQGTLFERIHACLTRDPRRPSELAPPGSRSLDAVVLRALAREPSDRFGSVDELGAAVLPFASAAVRARWQTEMGAAEAGAPSRLRRWIAAAGVVALAVVLTGLAASRMVGAARAPAVSPPVPPQVAASAVRAAPPPSAPPVRIAPVALLPAPPSAAPSAGASPAGPPRSPASRPGHRVVPVLAPPTSVPPVPSTATPPVQFAAPAIAPAPPAPAASGTSGEHGTNGAPIIEP